jgi:hypothetical protein
VVFSGNCFGKLHQQHRTHSIWVVWVMI